MTKLCPKCGEPKHITGSGRLCTYCLACELEYSRQKRKGAKYKEYASRYVRTEDYRKKHLAQNYAYIAHPVAQQCEVDGCQEIGERHHDDYSKATEIRWLCRQHHVEHHKHG